VSGHDKFHQGVFAAGEHTLEVAGQGGFERFFFLPLRMFRCQRFDPVKGEASLSNTAMRSGSGTKSLPPGAVTRWTKSTTDCFALPSVHDGSGSAAVAKDEIASQKASTTTAVSLRCIVLFLVCIPYR